ncbi:DUF1697 domain-containing protein [Clostridium sp. CS001]|uniref:DUF1697 domain-containing protein n=1 Tax=Clostridium sp. CS001 TaxID=2880648 RepID=UPI001CF4665C|nr:DUF1697 domain-containing protein [Clostridium sp. CS001]MCB2290912.1 DUF1697 domain-containing protein [Clostridium sp. CS001]
MKIYIALLRGINVGGKNIIKMADLKHMLESIGLQGSQTYIQSGNILFKSNEEEQPLRNKIEHAIEKTFGFSIAVIIRQSVELEKIIQNCPFSKESILKAESSAEGEILYVAMLSHEPLQENILRLNAYKSESEEYLIEGIDIYLLFSNSIRNSKIATNLHKLEVPVTVRNWKTINKLLLLAKAMEIL